MKLSLLAFALNARIKSIQPQNYLAIFIDEESGGTMERNAFAGYARLVLPNTKIRVEIPLTKTAHHTKFIKGRGVLPDYSLTSKIEDLVKGIDTELDFTLKLIESKK